MQKDLFFDYGELLFAYHFSQDTLMRAHRLALPQLAPFSDQLTIDKMVRANDIVIGEYLAARKKTNEEWSMHRIMGRCLDILGITDERAIDLAVDIYKLNDHDASPLPGIPELMRELASERPLHIISNLPHDSAIHRLQEHGLRDCFSTITFSYEAGYRKPRPEIYRLALERTGCEPHNGLFISHDEDEVLGARQVGMHSFLAKTADEIRRGLYEDHL